MMKEKLVGSFRHLVFRVYNCNRRVKAGKPNEESARKERVR